MIIRFYKTHAINGWMNNYYPSSIFLYNNWWSSVEAAFQSQKTDDPEEKRKIWQAKTPRLARELGQKIKTTSDWINRQDQVMYDCILAKFLQSDKLRIDLIRTMTIKLVFDSPTDYYWGAGTDDTGKNMLGQTLMAVRSDLIRNKFLSR